MRFFLKKINIAILLSALFAVGFVFLKKEISHAQIPRTIGTYAYIVNDKNVVISNGEYNVRFGIYRNNRTEMDPYPSDSDQGSRIWSETQRVKIHDGLLNAQLGTVEPLPQNLNFFEGEYYLGIRIETDSEMVPRKKIGAVPQAISAINLQGAILGSEEGNIMQLGKNGKIKSSYFDFDVDNFILNGDNRLHEKNSDVGTTAKTFNIGSKTKISSDADFDLIVSGDTNKPTLRFDGGQGKWMFSNDGRNFQAMGEVDDILTVAQGGTGIDSYVAGDILYYENGSTLSRLPIGLNGQVLAVSGGRVTWASSAPLSPHDILSVGHSDVIAATAQNGDLLIATGSPAKWTRLGGGSNGQVLTMSGGVPIWSTASSSVLHEFLSPTHTDVVPSAPVRGAIISGQGSSALWQVLTPNAAGQFLKFNGTDSIWSTLTKSDVGLSNVENTALSTWTGTTNITTLGTITSGTWNGSMISAQYGGTGISTYTRGDLLYSGSANTLNKLAVGVDGQVLMISGGVPIWSSSAPAAVHQLLSITHGDTTQAAPVRGDIITGQGASTTWTRLALGANGSILKSNGTDVTWSTLTKSDVGLSNVENTALSTWTGSTNITTLGTIATGTWNGSAIGAQYGGTGINTSALSGVPSISGGVWSVGARLATSLGGTGLNSSAAGNGQLLIGNGTGFSLSGITTSGSGLSITNGPGSINIANTGVTSISGTANQVSVSASSGDVVISLPQTISTTSNVTFSSLTLASPLLVAYGGTGINAYTAGDMLYYSSGTSLSKLAIGTNGQILMISGGVPVWSSSAPAAVHQLLSTTHGDTTQAAPVRGDIITGQGASTTWTRLALGASGSILKSNGTDAIWSTLTKSDVGLSNVENTALSTWTGTTNITTLGTIAAGTWNANAISLAKGGLGSDVSAINGLVKISGGITTSIADNSSNWNTAYSHSTSSGNPHSTTKADLGLENVENTALSTWSGSANLTTVGVIASGSWNGSIVGVAYGGTGTSNGSITGSGALSFASGGTNTGINLNPNGTGIVAVNGTLGIKAGSYKTSFSGSPSQGSDITYTLPSVDGTDGQVLKIDASNNLYWATVEGGTGGIGTVTSVASGNGLTGGPITGSGTLSVNLLSSASTTSTRSSFSGMEFVGATNQLALIQGCGESEVLAWNNTAKTWGCASVSGVGGLTGSGSDGYVAYWTSANSLSSEQYLDESRGGTGLNTSTATNGQLLIGNGTGFSLAALTQGSGITITNGAGTISIANSGVTGITGTTNQITASGSTGAITLSLPQNIHAAATPTFGGMTLNGNLALGANTLTTSNTNVVNNLNADMLDGYHAASFEAAISSGTNGQYWRGDKTWQTLNSSAVGLGNVENTALSTWAGSANITTLGTIASGTWNGSIIGTQYGGTGINTSTSTGVPSISSGTWSVSSQLSNALGGTGLNTSTATNGQLLIGNGTGFSLAALSQSTGITITNGAGTISIANSGVTSLAGTSNQVNVSASSGAVTISLPQTISTTSDVSFGTLTLSTPLGVASGGTGINGSAASNGQLLIGNGTGYSLATLSAGSGIGVTNAAGSITINNNGVTSLAGTADQVNVSASNGSVTLSLPQSIATTASPTFSGLSLTGLTQGSIPFIGSSGTVSQDNGNLFWNNTDKRLGIGTALPSSIAELYSSTANSMLTITAASATYSPLIQFKGGATPSALFTMGVDASDSNKFKIYPGNSIAGTNTFSIDSTGTTSISSLEMGAQNFAADSGSIAWIDMPVTAAAANGTIERYTARLDGNSMFTIYGTSNGAGGVANLGVGVNSVAPSAMFDVHGSGTTTGIAFQTADSAGAAKFSILDNGSVGIGTTTPGGTFSVRPTNAALAAIEISNTSGTLIGRFSQDLSGGAQDGIFFLNDASGVKQISFDSGSNSYFNFGNFGIGDSTPASLLTVGANDAFQVNASGQIISGTWMGSVVGAQYGGTGINGSAAANGTLLIGNGSGYSLATLTAGSGIGITNGAGSITIANNGVTSLSGTANQVNVSGATGAITLSLPQDIATTSSPTFAGLTLAYDGTHTGGLTVDSAGNLSVATTTGYTKFNKTATQNYLQIFDSAGLGYLQMTHNGTNALISTNVGSVELGTTGDLELASGVNIMGDGNFKIKGDASSRTITIGDTVKANDDIVAIDASNWSVGVSGMINGSFDGVGTKVVGANVTDGAFTGTAFNGLTAIDSSTGRFYYRYGGVWRYAAQAGGFQIPNYEVAPNEQLSQRALTEGANALAFEKTSHPEYLTKQMAEGEFLIPYVDEFLPDGAAHGLYARFDDVKGKMFANEMSEILGLKVKTDENITNIQELKSAFDSKFAMLGAQLATANSQIENVNGNQINLETRVATIESTMVVLQQQIEEVRSHVATPIDVAQLELNTQEISLIKMVLGLTTENPADVKLLGKLKATIIEGNKLVINVSDENAKTIGQATIVKISKDENNDGMDDENGSDGKTVFISTTAVNQNSKIFITPKVATEQALAVVETKFGEGFKVSLKNVLTNESEDISFDWMMVEEGL